MTWRPGAIALARAVNALFFVAVSAYCFLAYSPFAYDLFIKPSVLPALTDFVKVSPWLFWATLLATVLTLMPELRMRRALAWAYVSAGLVIGFLVFVRPPLATVGQTAKAIIVGMAALVPPVWLAAIDHLIWPAPEVRALDRGRALAACLLSAAMACVAYAVAAPFRMRSVIGLELPPRMLAVALVSSLLLDLFVFTTIFLAVTTIAGVVRLFADDGAGEYWVLIVTLALSGTFILYLLVCASIAFTGRDAWLCSAALSTALTAVWADVGRLRSQQSPVVSRQPDVVRHRSIDSLEAFSAPVVGVGWSRRTAAGVLVALPVITYALVHGVRQFDWNFLLQKLGVPIVWLLIFASAYTIAGLRRWSSSSSLGLAGVPIAVLVLYHLLAWTNPAMAIDRYAVVDPSLRLIRDARSVPSSGTAEYYAYLRSNTLLASRRVPAGDLDFVPGLGPASGRKPNIFLILVDSLRRDYLSPYNPRVTFTPRIGKLAADSFVFQRAFTRYSGTGLAVPAIWAGGMLPHMMQQKEFGRRNTLLKLLDANDYVRVMDMDSVVTELVARDHHLVELDRGKGTMDFDLCATLDELAQRLPQERSRPAFFYSLPQNVHIAVATRRNVPAGESYPAGFDDRIASSVHHIDACLGEFVDFLKREHVYDDSVIILTSDHGDSLGEQGRWGHAYLMYPEVMNIPLIVHVPSWLKARVRTDLDAVVFSTDITPSLYALVGYEPRDLGSLFGRSFFTPRDRNASWRRRESFLLASSYGAVYGLIRHNGRRLYVVDAVEGREYAFDLAAVPEPVAVTPAMMAVHRRVIARELAALGSVYRYRP